MSRSAILVPVTCGPRWGLLSPRGSSPRDCPGSLLPVAHFLLGSGTFCPVCDRMVHFTVPPLDGPRGTTLIEPDRQDARGSGHAVEVALLRARPRLKPVPPAIRAFIPPPDVSSPPTYHPQESQLENPGCTPWVGVGPRLETKDSIPPHLSNLAGGHPGRDAILPVRGSKLSICLPAVDDAGCRHLGASWGAWERMTLADLAIVADLRQARQVRQVSPVGEGVKGASIPAPGPSGQK